MMARCHIMQILKWTKELSIESEIGKIFPHKVNKSNTGYEDSLALDQEVFQAQGLYSMKPSGFQKTPCMRMPFPTK